MPLSKDPMVLADQFKVTTKETIAVTGATGFIGRHVCSGLEHAGFSVRRLSRNGGPEANHFATGDMTESPRWADLLANVDAVIHCAAIAIAPRETDAESLNVLYRVNCEAVDALAQACVNKGVRQLIFLSSAKVYGESTTGRSAFQESDPLSPKDEYGRSKRLAEELLKNYEENQLQLCVLRLPLVYGPGAKGNFQSLRRLAVSGIPLPLASIKNRRSVLSIENLLTVLCCLLDRGDMRTCTLNVADPGPVSLPELIRGIAESAGKKARLVHVPLGLMRVIGQFLGAGKALEKLTGSLEISTERISKALPEAVLYETPTALSRLGLSLHPSLRRCDQ